jgi:quinoprotein glucose dehydrogenase
MAGNATPATYEVGGRQFIVIYATGGKGKPGDPSGGVYVAFALPATPNKSGTTGPAALRPGQH